MIALANRNGGKPVRVVSTSKAAIEDGVVRAILDDITGERLAACCGWGQAQVFQQRKFNHLVHALENVSRELGGFDTEALPGIAQHCGIPLLELLQLKDACTQSDVVGFKDAVQLVYQTFISGKCAQIAKAVAAENNPEKLSSLAADLERVARAASSGIAAWGDRLAERLFDPAKPVSKPLPVLLFGDIEVCTRGNLSLVTAHQKHGKSAGIGAMVAALLKGETGEGDTFGINAQNPDGHAVIHLDTEQSTYDHHHLLQTTLKRVGVEKLPSWLYSYSVLGVSIEETWRHIDERLITLRAKHRGVCLLIIDGVGDLVVDVNDAKECVPAVQRLQALAVRYNCAILSVLHLNPGSRPETAKSRGHLGSTLERKVEVDLRIVKDKEEISTIFTACSRRESIPLDKGLRFRWSPEHGMHMTAKAGAKKTEDKKVTAHREFCLEIFGEAKLLSYTEICGAIAKLKGLSAKSAERYFAEFKTLGLIQKAEGKWQLSPSDEAEESSNSGDLVTE